MGSFSKDYRYYNITLDHIVGIILTLVLEYPYNYVHFRFLNIS